MAASNFSKKHENFSSRQRLGFSRKSDPIIVSTNGLAWFLNYIHDASKRGVLVSQSVIDAVCLWKFVGTVRDTWIVVTRMPIYEEPSAYYRVTAYLNGTGAGETILDFPRETEVGRMLKIATGLHHTGAIPFKVGCVDSFTLQLSEEEVGTLRGVGVLRITPAVIDEESRIVSPAK